MLEILDQNENPTEVLVNNLERPNLMKSSLATLHEVRFGIL